ncbi:MAG: hypothetical protein JWR37_6118, partial [Mycobacterium sp.]|nr:hypothetical protein [Mycobacterium sp.]
MAGSEPVFALGDDEPAVSVPDDSRRSVTYLAVPESTEFIGIMALLESSASDLTPA